MFEINIRSDIEKAKRQFSELSGQKMHLGIARAINHTLGKAKTEASRQIRQEYNMKAGSVKEALDVIKTDRIKMTGYIRANAKLIAARHFAPKQTKKGVSIKILKSGPRKLIKSAFMATMPNGGFGVFARGRAAGNEFKFRHHREVRAHKGHKYNGYWRPKADDLDVNNIKTVSAYGAFMNERVMRGVAERVQQDFPQRVMHELGRLTK